MVVWSPGITLEEAEKSIIKKCLSFHAGDKVTTCQSLNISKKALDKKLEQYEKDDEVLIAKLNQDRERQEEFDRRARGFAV